MSISQSVRCYCPVTDQSFHGNLCIEIAKTAIPRMSQVYHTKQTENASLKSMFLIKCPIAANKDSLVQFLCGFINCKQEKTGKLTTNLSCK